MTLTSKVFSAHETALIQTAGRAARNSEGRVIMYADQVTVAMEAAISETYRRRQIQESFNEEHNILPQTIRKEVRNILEISSKESTEKRTQGYQKQMSPREKSELIRQLTVEMRNAAKILEFEHAAYLRDKIERIKLGK